MLGFSWERLQSRCFCSSVPKSIVAEATPTTTIGDARLFVGATSVAMLGFSWERLQSRCFCSSVPKSIVAEATPTTTIGDARLFVGATSVAMLLLQRAEQHRG